MPILHIYLLGEFLLTSDNTPITTITIPRVQSLLAYLLLHRVAPQNRSHLAFLLWPDSTEAQAHTNLRQLLHHLRQSLPDAEHFLAINKHSVQWLPLREGHTFTLDVLEFEEILAQAKQAEHVQDMGTVRQMLEQGLALYRGELLPNCYEEWILPEGDRLRLFLKNKPLNACLFFKNRNRTIPLQLQPHINSCIMILYKRQRIANSCISICFKIIEQQHYERIAPALHP